MSKTKIELKKETKNTKAVYSWAIKLKCFDCLNCFADRELCNQTDCSLFPFTFNRGDLKTKIFKSLIKTHKKFLKNDQYPRPSFWLEVINKKVLGSTNGVKKH